MEIHPLLSYAKSGGGGRRHAEKKGLTLGSKTKGI